MQALFNILMASIEVAIPNSIEYGLLLLRLVFLGYAFHGLMYEAHCSRVSSHSSSLPALCLIHQVSDDQVAGWWWQQPV